MTTEHEEQQLNTAEETEETDQGSEQSEQSESNDDVARTQGWRPLAEFKGDPDDWVDAKTFLEKSERNAPMMRERNRKLASTVETQRQELAELKRRQDLQDRMYERLTARAKEEALEQLRKEQKAAMDLDEDERNRRFDELEAKKAKVVEEFKPEAPKAPAGKPVEIQEWEAENEWVYSDVIMQGAANALFTDIAQKFPGLPLAKQLAKVKEGIVQRFPDKFANPKRESQNANAGGKPKGVVKKTKGWEDVPEKDRAWAEKSLRRSGVSKEAWAKEYWELSNIQ